MPTVMEEFDLMEISAVDRPAQAHAKAVIIKRADAEKGGGKPAFLADDEDEDEEKSMHGKEPKAKKGGGKDKDAKGMDLGLDEEDDEEAGKGKGKKPVTKSPGEMAAAGVLTSAEDGHSHLLDIYPGQRSGTTSYQTSDASGVKGGSHDHPWAYDAEGRMIIGFADGHDHQVDQADVDAALLRTLKNSEDLKAGSDDQTAADAATKMEDSEMPDSNEKVTLEGLQTQIADLTKAKDRAEAVAALSADQRGHFDTLKGEDQEGFLNKSTDERDEIVKSAGDADPVVYKSASGDLFRQSDDVRLVKAVQAADEAQKSANTEREAREGLELAKRADEILGNLPGDSNVRGQLLKAVESIEDEDIRKGALECLGAANGGIFERANGTPEQHGLAKGAGFQPSTGAEQELEKMVQKYAETNSVPEYKAWDEVLKSAEGSALYQKSTTERGGQLSN